MKYPTPKLPSLRDIVCRCGTVNRYRTVCTNCSATLPNHHTQGPEHEEKEPQDLGLVSPGFPADCLHRRDRESAGFLDQVKQRPSFTQYVVYAFVGVVIFFGFLNLVSDQPKPSITFTADSSPPDCPIKNACDNQ